MCLEVAASGACSRRGDSVGLANGLHPTIEVTIAPFSNARTYAVHLAVNSTVSHVHRILSSAHCHRVRHQPRYPDLPYLPPISPIIILRPATRTLAICRLRH